MKTAPTERSPSMDTVQVSDVPLALQSPVHPRKTCLFAGLAVSVMLVPTVSDCEHFFPQLMSLGVLVTFPEPVTVTVRVYC